MKFSKCSSAIAAAAASVILLHATIGFAGPEYEFNGKARLKYEDTQGYSATAHSRTAYWSVRIRPLLKLKVDEFASIVVEPQFAKALGRTYSYVETGSSGTAIYNENFHVHQGYLNLRFSDEFQIRGGRFSLDYGNGAVIGAADWGVFGRAYDGLQVSYTSSLFDAELSHEKLVSTAGALDADKELAIIYTKWRLAEAVKAFDVYGLYEANKVAAQNQYRFTAGTRIATKFDAFDVGVEYAAEKGSSAYMSQSDSTGSMLIAEVGYTFPDFAKLRVGLEFNQADENWREWYPTIKAPLGRNDIVGRPNLTAAALRLKAELSEKLSMNLDYWWYSRTSTSSTPFRTDGTTAVGTVAASSAKDIGNSVELSAKYRLSEKVEYGIGAAMFSQGTYLKENFGDRTLTDFYAMASISF